MIINRVYETQNLLSLSLVFFLVGLRTYQPPPSLYLLSSENTIQDVVSVMCVCV